MTSTVDELAGVVREPGPLGQAVRVERRRASRRTATRMSRRTTPCRSRTRTGGSDERPPDLVAGEERRGPVWNQRSWHRLTLASRRVAGSRKRSSHRSRSPGSEQGGRSTAMPTNGHRATREAIIAAAERCSPPTASTACRSRDQPGRRAEQHGGGAVPLRRPRRAGAGRSSPSTAARPSRAATPCSTITRTSASTTCGPSPPRWSPPRRPSWTIPTAGVSTCRSRPSSTPAPRWSTRIPELGPTDSIARWHKLLDPWCPTRSG